MIIFAVNHIERALIWIFGMVEFMDFPVAIWEGILKRHQNAYNAAITEFHHKKDIARRRAEGLSDYAEGLAQEIDTIEVEVNEWAVRVNDGIRAALGNTSTPALLKELIALDPLLADVIKNRLDDIRMDALARQRRTNRGGLYVASQCIRLEPMYATINEQWKAVYRLLENYRVAGLKGDVKEAWEWFRRQQPYSRVGHDLENFEKEISRLKRIIRNENSTYEQLPKKSRRKRGKLE